VRQIGSDFGDQPVAQHVPLAAAHHDAPRRD
jgi:hypothetical protein